MKFLVIFLLIGFASNLHAEGINYAPGESTRDGVFEHEKDDNQVGTGFQTSSCGDCDTAQKNQRRLGSITTGTSSSGSSSSQGNQ